MSAHALPLAALLRIDAGLIDIGGHRTEAVKAFVRSRRVRRLMAGFGATANNATVLGKGKAVDVNWRGQSDRRGVMIHQVGTVAMTKRALSENAEPWLLEATQR